VDARERASRRTLKFAGLAIAAALTDEATRAQKPGSPTWPDFPLRAKRKVLFIKGLGSTSDDKIFNDIAEVIPDFAPCEFSYRGRGNSAYSQVDSIETFFNLGTEAGYIDDYLPADEDADRLIIAHSMGGVLAYQWAWRRRRVLERSVARTRVFLIASPVFVRVPHTGYTITWQDDNGNAVTRLLRGTDYPPDRVPPGLSLVGSCFASRDLAAAPAICRLPDAANSINYPEIGDADHRSICANEKTKQYLAHFVEEPDRSTHSVESSARSPEP
jgi:pimeloyl-ACP methyl ester carboxylesterase